MFWQEKSTIFWLNYEVGSGGNRHTGDISRHFARKKTLHDLHIWMRELRVEIENKFSTNDCVITSFGIIKENY